MKLLTTLTAGFVAGAALLATSSEAHAMGPIAIEVGGKAGVGSNPTNAPINPYGFGLGARAGISLLGLYGGVNLVDYFGGDNGVVSAHALETGFEAGFGITLFALTIRPQVGFGRLSFTSQSADASVTDHYFYLEPGLTGLITFDTIFIGVDWNLLVVPAVTTTPLEAISHTETSTTLHGQIGLRF